MLVDAFSGWKGQGWGQCSSPPALSPAQQDGDIHLSASTSSGGVPAAHRRTIHAASKAARKPRATPVPSGQKGCEGKGRDGAGAAQLVGMVGKRLGAAGLGRG